MWAAEGQSSASCKHSSNQAPQTRRTCFGSSSPADAWLANRDRLLAGICAVVHLIAATSNVPGTADQARQSSCPLPSGCFSSLGMGEELALVGTALALLSGWRLMFFAAPHHHTLLAVSLRA